MAGRQANVKQSWQARHCVLNTLRRGWQASHAASRHGGPGLELCGGGYVAQGAVGVDGVRHDVWKKQEKLAGDMQAQSEMQMKTHSKIAAADETRQHAGRETR